MFRKIRENWLTVWYIVVIALTIFSMVADVLL